MTRGIRTAPRITMFDFLDAGKEHEEFGTATDLELEDRYVLNGF